ncbi:hypothetical protein [uncultured Nitratireductor sp.]|uniref:HdeD family acid-resistance protein n=1 Tax=uncultured Nitratireductor sp. TaxID=520953 RepID=UPI0025D0B5F6|nr:hypothetical protein [uncultured Nitratireductor sp.]
MRHWILWLLAGIAALIGGLAALFNLNSASNMTLTVGGCALVVVGALQGWAAYRAPDLRTATGAAVLAAAGLFIGFSLLFGPFGDGRMLRILLGVLLIASGFGKVWVGRSLRSDSVFPMLLAAGGVSAILGLLVLSGIGIIDFGLVVALELLASGVALVLLSLRLKNNA